MPPRRITRLAVQYDDGKVEEWAGTGNAQVYDNMVPENERHETPKPHTWMEVRAMLRIEGSEDR